MKLLFIIDSLGSGGAQRQMSTLAAGMASRGHQVEIFTYYPGSHFSSVVEQAGVAVHLHPKPSQYSFRPLLALRSLLKSGEFDCALAFLETPSLYAELARIGLDKTKLVVSERFCFSPETLTWQGRIQQEMHRLADWITVNSFHQQETMLQMFPWMKSRLSVIWNGCDVDHFQALPLPDKRENVLRVQVLASLARKKNPLGLATAVMVCRDEFGLRVEVNWAGRFTADSEKIIQREVAEFLEKAGLAGSWEWAGEVHDIRPLLAACDAVVHPSFAEGLPNSVCEALSSGRPVLVSRIGDHALLVNSDANGMLYNPYDPMCIAHMLVRYSRLDGVARQSMANSAREFAEKELSIDRFVQAYEDLFIRLS